MATAIEIPEEAYHPQINNDTDALVEDTDEGSDIANNNGTYLEDAEAATMTIDPEEDAIFKTLYNNKDEEGYWDTLTYKQLKKIASILKVGAFTAMLHQWIASDKKKHMTWHISKTHSLIGYARRKIINIEKKKSTNHLIENIDSGTWATILKDFIQLRILATDTTLSWRQELIDYSNDDDKNNGFWTTKKCRAIQKWAYDCFTHPKRLQKYNEFKDEIKSYNRDMNNEKMIATDVLFAFTIFTNYGKYYQKAIYTKLNGKIRHYNTEAPVDWKEDVKMAIINKFGKKDRHGDFEDTYTVLIEVNNVVVRDEKFTGYESDKSVEHLHFDFFGEDNSYKEIRPVKKPGELAAEPDIY